MDSLARGSRGFRFSVITVTAEFG